MPILTIGHSLYDFLPFLPQLTAARLMGLLHTVPAAQEIMSTSHKISFVPIHVYTIPSIQSPDKATHIHHFPGPRFYNEKIRNLGDEATGT